MGDELTNLFKQTASAFGKQIRIIANSRDALKQYSPTGKARARSFEITDVHRDRLLYSRLQTGASIYSDTKSDYRNKWFQAVAAKTGMTFLGLSRELAFK